MEKFTNVSVKHPNLDRQMPLFPLDFSLPLGQLSRLSLKKQGDRYKAALVGGVGGFISFAMSECLTDYNIHNLLNKIFDLWIFWLLYITMHIYRYFGYSHNPIYTITHAYFDFLDG